MKLILAMLVATLAAGSDKPQATKPSPEITQAVANFEPFTLTAGEDLRGVKIGLDWEAGAGCTESCARRLAMTAGYLFHAVQRRGGRLMLSHAPGDVALDRAERRQQRWQLLQASNCDLAIVLCCSHVPGKSGFAGGASSGQRADELISTLQAALGPDWSTAAGPPSGSPGTELAPLLNCPVAEVHAPVPSTDPDSEWRGARADARTLVDAIARYAQTHAPAQPGGEVEPLPGAGRAARLARDLWPEGPLPVERAGWLCGLVQRLALTNPSLVYARIEVEPALDGVTLSGAASSPCVGNILQEALHAVGIDKVANNIRMLPDRSRLGPRAYGACCVASVLTHNGPSEQAGLQTELLFGEPVQLLDRDRDHLLLLGGDGYWGWARCETVALMDEVEFTDYVGAAEGLVLHDVATNGQRIPRGARVRLGAVSAGAVEVIVPGGGRVRVSTEAVEPVDDAPAAARRVQAALDLLHTPYVFGGRSPAGLDCSGLVNNVSVRCGVPAARDANQQALAGRLSATAWFRAGMQAGDQVFFIDQSGKVYHTGIAVDAVHIVHSAPPGVQIGTFVQGDRLYDTRIDRDFFIAKRP